ncbi:MAG TPA: thiol:disulfide interchange protein [Gammaproteobacteria bacterium]|nr:thiol:disulfide interchange protein [Gammaproteobacteria bacterium]
MVFFRERVNGLLSLNARNGAKRRGCSSAVSGQRFFPLLLVLTASCLATFSVAAEDFTRPPAQPFQEPAFLPVDDAFAIRAELADSGAARITWDVAPDYYLYRHQFSVRVDGVKIDQLQIPSGQEKFDEFFGDVEVYYQFAELTLSETRLDEGAQLVVMYQGCAERGLCYPPEQRQFIYTGGRLLPSYGVTESAASANTTQVIGEDRALADVLANASLITILAVFFVAGVGLTFTPCVFPMLPILSSIIVGQGKDLAKRRALSLSAAYVLGMAVTFAAVGLLVGLFGAELNLQAKLQSPAVLIISALIFTLLAGAMFGFYELALPQAVQQWLDDRARAQQAQVASGSSHRSVFVMGALSSLVVSPCITPPLAGALIYLSNTGDVVLGGSALFTLALGMGVPLMIVGGTGGHWLPRAGGWMDLVKAAFGVGLLAVAIWLLARLLPAPLVLLLWGALLIGCGVFLGALVFSERQQGQGGLQVVGILALVWGVMCVVGAGLGNTDPLKPLGGFGSDMAQAGKNEQILQWRAVKSLADVQQAARGSQTPVLLDLYADWCISCKVMEEQVFPSAAVAPLLGRFELLRADVTRNDAIDRELLNHYGLFGPPSLVFFGKDGSEIEELRLQGEVSEQQLVPHLQAILAQNAGK